MKSHIQIPSDIGIKNVITCGAPERAALIASRLEQSQPISKNREYHSYKGMYKGVSVMIVSHGVGASGAAICFHELFELGIQKIIRVGTAGALHDKLGIGDLVVTTAAVRKDGVGSQMVPDCFPAVADLDLTQKILVSALEQEIAVTKGIVVSSDVFYPGLLDTQLELFKRAGAIAVEMECSTLFLMATLKGVAAASILGLDGNPLKWEEGVYDPSGEKLKNALNSAIGVALNAVTRSG